MRHHLFTGALLLTISLPGSGASQPRAADRVRITTTAGLTVTGVVADVSPDSFQVLAGPQSRWVRQAEVSSVQRSVRRERRFVRNLAITTVSSAATVGMIAAMTWSPCVSTEFLGCLMHPESRSGAFMFGAVVGGTFSIPVGVIVGLALRHDVWERPQGW